MTGLFHPIVQEWFRSRFAAPTEAQARGWPAIAGGSHTLISAPTGSGKTLAAFLICIDRLLRDGIAGRLPDLAQVVYVSPLKALSSDVHRNLSVPLREIAAMARGSGCVLPDIRIALRTGDTPAHERQAMARRPPHIWITTPESLYLLVTSASGRRGLRGVHTVILDEIHAVADDKRGSHLALTVERLCALAGGPVTRIGLSATQRPIEEVARFLVGTGEIEPGGAPRCAIVDVGHRRAMDLQIALPEIELGPIATLEHYDETVRQIAELAREHRTTLVFANTRRLVERIAHLLSQRLGAEAVAAHHGSLSRKTRQRVEARLKQGEARVCVASASLELGIDIGFVDLVCQVGSPRSIAVLIQRVGRSGHCLGGVSKGRLFPLTRDELVECAGLLLAAGRGDLDEMSIPPWPLDILAQQIVAMCSAEDWDVEELYRLVCGAYPYAGLPRAMFDRVVAMLSEGIAARLGYRSAYLHYDGLHGRLRARRSARIAALTGGGAIPDTADYDVFLEPDGTRVGSVNEDFAVESMAGDVFLLGNSSWRILRIERGRIRVADAGGQPPNIPFWLGEAPSRTAELSRAVSEIREGIRERLPDRERCLSWLTREVGLTMAGAEQAAAYIAEGVRVLGTVPAAGRIIAERFFDESGGMQVVLHAPLGGRINRAWGLALRQRFRRTYGFELQAAATDDGINLSLGPQHSFPLEEIFRLLRPGRIGETLAQAVLASPIFATRWRWALGRSLALPRQVRGRKAPAAIQRMRADDLLGAVFPAQSQDPDSRAGGDILIPDHPLVFETLRDCLSEALDVEGLRCVLEKLERGEVELLARDTPVPSVFSHQVLNAMPYAFLDDAPLEERRARAVMLRRSLPEQAGDLGRLDPEAIRSVSEDAWPAVRDSEELHDLLLGLILFPETMKHRLPAQAELWMEELAACGRAIRVGSTRGRCWMAAERAPLAAGPAGLLASAAVAGWTEVSGPVTAAGLALCLGLEPASVHTALEGLEGEGRLLRGSFAGHGEEEFCDRRILARIHRATLAKLRREIEPVSASDFLRFLFQWQHVAPGFRLAGEPGLLEVIDQLQGFETAATAWESEILPARVAGYNPACLDAVCLGGEVVWGRWTRRDTQAEVPSRRPGLTRSAVLGLGMRRDLGWLLDPVKADEAALSPSSRDVLRHLRANGASFFAEIISGTRRLAAEVEDALWQLAAAGWVTADAFSALRTLIGGELRRARNRRRRQQCRRRLREGRWSLLVAAGGAPENRTELRVRQYLRRYGVLLRELLAREPAPPPWRELLAVLRGLEARGEIRGGRFVAGLAGEQYALPEAVDALRAIRRSERNGDLVRVSGCDPLNLVGILTPEARVAAVIGNRVTYRDGVPVTGCSTPESHRIPQSEDRGLSSLSP
jgi:ATP-dependent Lhr-like helicase